MHGARRDRAERRLAGRRRGQVAQRDAVEVHLARQIQGLAGIPQDDLSRGAAAIEAQFLKVRGQDALVNAHGEIDGAGREAARLDAAEADSNLCFHRVQRREIERLFRYAGQQVAGWRRFFRDRRVRDVLGRRRRQVTVDVHLVALDVQDQHRDGTAGVHHAGGPRAQPLAFDDQFLEHRLRRVPVGGEHQLERQRLRVGLRLGQRLAQPGGQIGH